MKTFYTIAQKIIGTPILYYPCEDLTGFYFKIFHHSMQSPNSEEYFKVYNMIYHIYFLYKISKHKYTWYSAKYTVLNKVLENIFLGEIYKENYLQLFSRTQRYYMALNRFAYLYKFKKAKLQVSNDLSLQPILINNQNTILIMQNNAKYLFVLNDLINIIETSISNAPSFFLHILTPKNPYTNICFNKSTLYNIYFKYKSSTYNTSILFHLYFLSHFNNNLYSLENEAIIRDFAIKKYIYKSPSCELVLKVKQMLQANPYTRKLYIHLEFSEELLVDIMRPFLYYKFMSDYGVEGTEKILLYKKWLFFKLKKFYEFNKQFGRVIYKFISRGKKDRLFNTEHISFSLIKISQREINEYDSIILQFISPNNHYSYVDVDVDDENEDDSTESSETNHYDEYYVPSINDPLESNLAIPLEIEDFYEDERDSYS